MEPTQQDKAEQVDELASNATRACFARFRSCIAALDGEHRNHLEVRFADLKLWADSVGALAHGKASLDWRLSGRSMDIFLVTSLLDMLEQFLEGYKAAAIEDGDEDKIEEAEQGIDEMTDNLAWIGSAIRRSGTKSRLQRADMSFERDRAGKDKWHCDQLRAHLICIMKSRPTEPAKSKDYSKDFHSMELQEVQNRLVEANLRRWHRFRYAQRHSDVLRASQAVQNMPMHGLPEGSAPDSAAEPTNTPVPRINTAGAKQRNETNDQSETRTIAGLSASAFGSEYQGLEGRYTRPAKSTMTRISTITRFARFPRVKKPQTQRKTLLCPCCCQALPLEEAEDPDLWARHIKNDISPYTCIVENCPTPYRFYVTRNEWREHVLCDHPPKWRCSCCTGARPVFQSLPSFMAHLDEKHESQVSDDTFERIVAKSTFRTFGITNCPLCNDNGPTDSPELIEHILGHIYDFSMYALPWRTTPQRGLNKPIRTFNDVAPVLDPNDDKDATEMRMFSYTRILEWVKEPHLEEENLTPEQRATIRDLDWDDYQAMDNENGADPIVADYFDRAEIDYFEDDASSRWTSSKLSHSASTRHLSIASSRRYGSRTQANPPLSAQEMDSALAEAIIAADDDESFPNKEGIEAMHKRMLQDREEAVGPKRTSTLDIVNKLGGPYAVSHERERSRAPRSSESDQEIIIYRDQREGPRSRDREREEIIVPNYSRSNSSAIVSGLHPGAYYRAPPYPPSTIIAPPPQREDPISCAIHRDYEITLTPPASPPPSPPSLPSLSPERERARSGERIAIHRSGEREGREYKEDIIIDRNDTRSCSPLPPPALRRDPYHDNPPAHPPPEPYDRDAEEEAAYYNDIAKQRGYIGEAYDGATRDWSLVDVPPGTRRGLIDGAEQEITWQQYNSVRRSKFYADGAPSDGCIDGAQPAPTAGAGGLSVSCGKPRDPRDGLWTEITKDLVVKEAIEEIGYEYEETDDFYYIFKYLSYEDIARLVSLSDDIKNARQKRTLETGWESRVLPEPAANPAPPRLLIEPGHDRRDHHPLLGGDRPQTKSISSHRVDDDNNGVHNSTIIVD